MDIADDAKGFEGNVPGFALGPVMGERRVLTVFSALDNLIKGGAGQAIQSLNLMLGAPEATGIDELGPYP